MLVGDFDVTLDLDLKKLDIPSPGGESTVLIQAEVKDESKTYVESKFAISDQGETAGEILIRQANDAGRYDYRELARLPIKDVQQIRMARRAGLAYFIVKNKAGKSKILGRVELGELPILPANLRVIVHTGGEGNETVVLLKDLKIQADQIQSIAR